MERKKNRPLKKDSAREAADKEKEKGVCPKEKKDCQQCENSYCPEED